MDKQSVLTSCF